MEKKRESNVFIYLFEICHETVSVSTNTQLGKQKKGKVRRRDPRYTRNKMTPITEKVQATFPTENSI